VAALVTVAAAAAALVLLVTGGGPARATFPVPAHPTGLAVAGGQGWVAAPQSGVVTVLDAATGRRIGAPVRTGGAPARLALGAEGVWVADTERGAVVPVRRRGEHAYDPLPVGADVTDVALAARAVWALSSAEGVVRTLEPGTDRVRTLTAGSDPVDLAADERHVVVASAGNAELTWIDARARRVIGSARVGGVPVAVAVAGDSAWVADAHGAGVARVDLRTGDVGKPVRVGPDPVAVAADGDEVYVLCAGDRMVWHVEGDEVRWKRPAGAEPTALALDDDNVWVADAGRDVVIRLER
jgi:DNA-binding beta-propeller fold protein YncE